MMGSQQGMMGMKPSPVGMQQQGTMGMYPMGMGTQGVMGNQGVMGTQGMMGNWQAPAANQMGGGGAMGQVSGAFDPLAPVQQSQTQKKSDSLLDL